MHSREITAIWVFLPRYRRMSDEEEFHLIHR